MPVTEASRHASYLPGKSFAFLNVFRTVLCILLLAASVLCAQASSSSTKSEEFQINPGLNDVWFDPATNGQGFFITVYPDIGKVLLAWFTYDSERPPDDVEALLGEPGHRWMTAIGDYNGTQAELIIEFASGGIFDTPTDITRTDGGTITLTFTGCNQGAVEYNIPAINRSGSVPIQRATTDNVEACEQFGDEGQSLRTQSEPPRVLQSTELQVNPGLNDAWFNPATNGQGFFINVFPALQKVNLAWFTYDTVRPDGDVEALLGEPGHRWLTGLGDINGTQVLMPIELASGGLFDTPTAISRVDGGTILLTFINCNEATVEYNIPSINKSGIVPIQRVATDNIARCEAAGGVDPPINSAPAADAGPDQIVLGGSTVNLAGERSTDAEGPIKSVRWSQLSGPAVNLIDRNELNARFIAPDVSGSLNNPDQVTTLRFRLTTRDALDEIDTDSINVHVQPANLSIQLTLVSNEGNENPEILLLDQQGDTIASAVGNNALINMNLPAGVYYAFPSATLPADLDVAISASTGLVIEREIRPADMNGNFVFISSTEFESVDVMPLLVNANDSPGNGHRQFIEITLKDPDPALRDPDKFLQFLNQPSLRYREDEATAEAYYAAVDPFRDRLSLSDWQFVNGFDDGADAHATYQNDVDLGFGRDMYARANNDGTFASYVRNFPNVDHAVADENLIATVAMEFTPAEGGGEPFTKFFVFGPDGSRILAADLDGRGAKFVPGLCNVCHGGQAKRLTQDESGKVIYPDDGNTNAQFLPWDLETFKYSQVPGLTRADQEPEFKKLNEFTLATYPPDPAQVSGVKWTGKAARDLIEGWYAKGDEFDPDYVPGGWAGHEDLYLEVVGPNCRACHVNRGTDQQNAVDFGTYEKFIGYAPLIRSLVFDQGVMPLAVRTFGHFWSGGDSSAARSLAEALPAESDLVHQPNRSDPSLSLLKSGRPIARTGMAVETAPNFFLLTGKDNEVIMDGRASRFPVNQEWDVSSVGLEPEAVDQRGDLAITLQAGNNPENSDRVVRQIAGPGEVRRTRFIRAQSQENNPINPPTFFDDLWGQISADCGGCHRPNGIPGIPVFFDFPTGTDSGDSEYMYSNVLERIDFDDPLNSMMLTKPGGLRHGRNANKEETFGAAVFGWELFDANGDILDFFDRGSTANLLLEWIQTGARVNPEQQVKICRDSGLAIPDGSPQGIRDRMFIGPAATISDLSVRVIIDHERAGDLTLAISHVDSGASVTLLNQSCGNSRAIIGTFDDDGAANSGICPNVDEEAEFRPAGTLASLDGELVNGLWELEVVDGSEGFSGNLVQWCIFNSVP